MSVTTETDIDPDQDVASDPDKGVKLGVLTLLLEAATEDRKKWIARGKEAEELAYGEGYEDLYKQIEDTEFVWKAKINRAAEAVEIFAPYLYPQNPEVTIEPRGPQASIWNEQRHDVEKLYLDFAFARGDLASEARRAVNHGVLRGRVQLWTGYNDRRNIIAQQFVCVDDIFLDPDAKSYGEMNWIMRRREKPKWELIAMYPDQEEAIRLCDTTSAGKTGATDPQSEIVEYYEAFLRVGLHHYSSKLVGKDGQADETPKLYCFTKKGLLAEKEWPIPFHQIDAWPLELIDLRAGKADSIHPEGPLFNGIPHLKALCWIYTLYLNRVRLATRAAFMAASYNGQSIADEDIVKILSGKEFDVVRVKINGNELKLSDLLQQLNIETKMEELQQFVGLVNGEWEKSTALDSMLYSGSTRTQLRIAADVDLKKSQSMHRVDDMKEQMINGLARIAQKTLFAAHYLHDTEDIAIRWGEQAAAIWGTLAPDEVVKQETEMRKQAKEQMLMQAQMQAQEMMAMQQQMQAQQQAQVAVDGAPQQGGPVPQGAPPAMPQIPEPPNDQQMEEQLGPPMYLSMTEWKEEFDCTIEVSSMRRVDFEAQMENVTTVLTQLAPIIAPAPGGMQFVAAAIAEMAELSKFSPNLKKAAAAFQGACDAAMAMPKPVAAPEGEAQESGRPNHGMLAKG